MSLRPSNLPKLAECACYESNPNPGPAAERGTALDALFRSRISGTPDQAEMFYQPTEADNAAVDWAVATARALAGGAEVIAREADCSVSIPGFAHPGTADALIPEKFAHADLKTGQKRNYREQMAAYALGLMEQHFASEWTAHLLFCDQKEVISHRFTFDEATRTVADVVARFHDPAKRPTPCGYCGWCAKENTCEARLTLASTALAVSAPEFDFSARAPSSMRFGSRLRRMPRNGSRRARTFPVGSLERGADQSSSTTSRSADTSRTSASTQFSLPTGTWPPRSSATSGRSSSLRNLSPKNM
jgi:hypothetical protein